jgi:hypothetical protein
MDALVPMIYWDMGGKKPDYDELYLHFLANSAGRHIYGGIQTKYKDSQEPIREIEFTRAVDGQGIVGFSYSGVDSRNAWPLYKAAYAEKASVPSMPWKSEPTTGAVLGVVLDPQGRPVTDAWVHLDDIPATWLTSADGLFCILNVPPGGPHAVTVQGPGLGTMTVGDVVVEAGKAARVEVRFEAKGPVSGNGSRETNTD